MKGERMKGERMKEGEIEKKGGSGCCCGLLPKREEQEIN